MTIRYPYVFEVTQRYIVWAEDEDEEGPDRLLARLNRYGDAYEMLDGVAATDGDFDIRRPYSWETVEERCDRPLPQCLHDGCTNLVYYSWADRYCHTHRGDAARGGEHDDGRRDLPAVPGVDLAGDGGQTAAGAGSTG